MLLELMSNGTLAELPAESAPYGLKIGDDRSVMVLLPHNKYLLGTFIQSNNKWIYADVNSREHQNVSLYDDQALSLINEGTNPTILSGKIVTELRKKLSMLTEPPGNYHATVSMLRTFMRYHSVFNQGIPDEKDFYAAMKSDLILEKAYWTLRFALSRGELESVGRLKSWLKAKPDTFNEKKFPANKSRIWFSIMDMPDKNALSELEELSFSPNEIKRMSAQNISPILIYNPKAGWLILGRFGRGGGNTIFFVWVYLNHEMYTELRERKKMSIQDIICAVWGEEETEEAMIERMKYKGADDA